MLNTHRLYSVSFSFWEACMFSGMVLRTSYYIVVSRTYVNLIVNKMDVCRLRLLTQCNQYTATASMSSCESILFSLFSFPYFVVVYFVWSWYALAIILFMYSSFCIQAGDPNLFQEKGQGQYEIWCKNQNSREYCFDIHKHLLLHISCCNSFMATLTQVINLHKYLFVFDLENFHQITIV